MSSRFKKQEKNIVALHRGRRLDYGAAFQSFDLSRSTDLEDLKSKRPPQQDLLLCFFLSVLCFIDAWQVFIINCRWIRGIQWMVQC
jgi:hypothetical protein